MRQIPRLREMLDEKDSAELHAIRAEIKVRHPRKERSERGEKPGLDMDTEALYLRDGEVDRHLTSGSYYGFADHVTRWLHAYGYRAGMGVRAADIALDAYALDCGVGPSMLVAANIERDRDRRIPSPGIEVGQVAYDAKTGKDRRLLRRADRGLLGEFEVWAVQDCNAAAGSPVPWDPDQVWPWVVHVDTLVPCRDDGRPIRVTFSMPASGPPGSHEWRAAELAAVKRAGIHEAMESFGFDPHQLGDDTAEVPVVDVVRQQAEDRRMGNIARSQAETRAALEAALGGEPELRTQPELARAVAAKIQMLQIDAEHYRSEAGKVAALEGSLVDMVHRETGLQVDLDRSRAEIRSLQAKLAAATLGGTDAERLRDLEAAGRDARDWLVEAMNRRSNGGDVDEVLALAHGRLEAMNLGDGDPDAEARTHAYPDDSAGADDGRVAALERAIVEAVGLLACHDLHGDETALAARQAFEGLGIPGLVMVTRCASCAEPIEGEAETCPDCGVSLFNNVVAGLEALGHEEGDGDA